MRAVVVGRKVFLKNRRAVNSYTAGFLKQMGKKKDVFNVKLNEMVEKSYVETKHDAENYVFRAKVTLGNAGKKTVWHRHRVLAYVEAIPTMFSWVPLQKNMMVAMAYIGER